MMRGVDISHYRTGLTIRQIRDAGNDFAIIKVTEGNFLIDSAAFGFYHEAFGLGFPVGCFCYSHAATEDQARREAAFLLETINGFPMPCGVFLDVEAPEMLVLPDTLLEAVINAFCDAVRDAGYTPGVYGSEYNLWRKIDANALREDVVVWVAHYGKEPDMPCDLWQSSDTGRIEGYSGNVDADEVRSKRFEDMVRKGFFQEPDKPPGDVPDTDAGDIAPDLSGAFDVLARYIQTKEFQNGFMAFWENAGKEQL